MKFENGIIESPENEIDEKCGGLGKVLFERCKKFEDRIAVIDAKTEEFDTYGSLLEKSVATAVELRNRGFKKQDLIALCSNKANVNANIPLFASLFLGCVTLSIFPKQTIDEFVEFFRMIQPKIIFVIAEVKDHLSEALKRLNIKIELIVFGDQFEEEFLTSEIQNNFQPTHIQDLGETCMIHLSSGSTDQPKMICLHHYYFLSLEFTFGFSTPRTDPNKYHFHNRPLGAVSLNYANWHWASSSIDLVNMTLVGGCRLLNDMMLPHEFWDDIAKYHVTNLFCMPEQAVKLIESYKPESRDVSSLYNISVSGYSMHEKHITAFQQLFPDTAIFPVYGLSECGLVTSFNADNPSHRMLYTRKLYSAGVPENGLLFKVVDLNTGLKCDQNQIGELRLKGKQIFKRFYNKDASASFDEEGYFKTGDLVSFDEDFCFTIFDRIKNVSRFFYNGVFYSVFLHEIENILLSHPALNGAIVVGVPDEKEGEKMMGVVQLKRDAVGIKGEDLTKYVNERVSEHKRLRKGVIFVDDFPRTTTGKIQRLQLKKDVLQKLNHS